jgi:hypothetical protein
MPENNILFDSVIGPFIVIGLSLNGPHCLHLWTVITVQEYTTEYYIIEYCVG